jgi:anaerobic selenocysteine-containing dehydrogenase
LNTKDLRGGCNPRAGSQHRWGLLSVKERRAALILFAEYRRLKQRSLQRPPRRAQDQFPRRKWSEHLRDVRARMQKLVGGEFA